MGRPGRVLCGRRLSAALAVVAAAVLAVLGASPAMAGPDSSELVVSGLQATPGQVRFFLAARGLPASALTTQSLTARIGDQRLTSTVESAPYTVRPDSLPRRTVLVFDISGSMAGQPLVAAKAAAVEYATGLPPDVQLGLVTVSTTATKALAPSTDRAAFSRAVDALAATGETALYDGIREAAHLLKPPASFGERHVVVLSDGADTKSTTKPADVTSDLAAAKTTMDVVAFGSQAGGAELKMLATTSGGTLLSAADGAELRRAFRGLAAELSAPVVVTVTVPPGLSGKAADLQLELSTPDGPVRTSVPVQLCTDLGAAGSQQAFTSQGGSSRLLIVALSGIGGALLLSAVIAVYLALGRSTMRRRLRQIDAFGVDRVPVAIAKSQLQHGSPVLRTALALSEKAVQRNDQQSRIAASLDRAGMALRPAEWFLARALAAGGCAGLLTLLLPWWLGLPIGLVVGWLFSGLYRTLREKRRVARFAELLPEALQLVVGALRSGFSLGQAIDAVVREGPEPVNTEFGRTLAETRLGGELEDALDRTAARNGSRDLAFLVMAIRIQREVGGNLSEVLEGAVDTMRERARIARHVKGLSAEGRLSAYVLIAMPLALAGYMFAFRGEYLRPLYTQPLGIAMLVASVLMVIAGTFWMMRLIKVEV